MLQQDSIITQHHAEPAGSAVSELPADTALDAAYDQFLELDFNLHHHAPRAESTWTLMPDSFALYRAHLDSALTETADVHRYLHDSFFERDSVYRTEVSSPGYGAAGDPVPYMLRSDNMITLLLLLCFVVFSVSLARSKHFITRQLKNFFYTSHGDDDETIGETSGELRFQLFLVFVGCLLIALAGYLFVTDRIAQTFVLANDFQLVALLFGAMVAYHGAKSLLYTVVNNVFFGSKKNIQYLKDSLFLNATMSVLLFPVVMLMIYFDLSVQNAIYFFGIVLIMVKILTFYKAWAIFFRQKGGVLQTFLYFCTLEVTPLLVFCGVMLALVDVLIIKF